MKIQVSFDGPDGLFEAHYEVNLPGTGHVNRMVKAAQQNPLGAQRSMVMSLVDPADADRLAADAEKYPGIVSSIGNRLLDAIGMTAEVTAKN